MSRIWAIILAAALIVTSLSITPLADDNTTPQEAATEETVAASDGTDQNVDIPTNTENNDTSDIEPGGGTGDEPVPDEAAADGGLDGVAADGGETAQTADSAAQDADSSLITPIPSNSSTTTVNSPVFNSTKLFKDTIQDNNKDEIIKNHPELEKLEICVDAPAGVFPEGSRLDVKFITDNKHRKAIDEAIEDKLSEDETIDDDVSVEETYSFDIKVIDRDGREVIPDTTKGEVTVSFKNVGVKEVEKDDDKDMTIVHVDEKNDNEVELFETELDAKQDIASIETEHFSIYTIVITTGNAEGTILKYYQGPTKDTSYFTIYDEDQLVAYRNMLAKAGASDSVVTILVNKDSANPLTGEGITGKGQGTFKVSDLNLNAKIMDDITVTKSWTAISNIPMTVTVNGKGHTITFADSTLSNPTNDAALYSAFATNVQGTVKSLILKYKTVTKTIAPIPAEDDDDTEYARITVRVDGKKAEIGEAITGAEALAISYDPENDNYITMERNDDLSLYETPLENLEEGKTYDIYYVYENENETISAATISRPASSGPLGASELKPYEVALDYVSVKYDLAGANTYKRLSDGNLSENVMAAVRVDVDDDGNCEAQEDYTAVLKAAEGFLIPTNKKNIAVKVENSTLTVDTDFTYAYDAVKKEGTITVHKDRITGPMMVTAKADSKEDNPSNKIILKTLGGKINDGKWKESDDPADGQSAYVLELYEGTVALPTTVSPIDDSPAIQFGGWYKDINRTQPASAEHAYQASTTTTYYAKWVMNPNGYTYQNQSENLYYQYQTDGDIDVAGYDNRNSGQVTYGNGGFHHKYYVGQLQNDTDGGSGISMYSNPNTDIFKQIPGTDIYVALVCSIKGGLINTSYVFENRGTSDFNNSLYFGICADVQIATDDHAQVYITTDDNGSQYFDMVNTHKTSSDLLGKKFRVYISGRNFGIDDLYSFWYGKYSGNSGNLSYEKFVFCNDPNKRFQSDDYDSALGLSWKLESVKKGDFVTKSTKMGMKDASADTIVTVNIDAGSGKFSDGSRTLEKTSDNKEVVVNSDGTITIKKKSGDEIINPPTRIGYKFDHWSTSKDGENVIAEGQSSKSLKAQTTLYAVYLEQPSNSVINNSHVQKVNGSEDLLVPELLGNIVINNKTPGVEDADRVIKQGESKEKSAGQSSGFIATLEMKGADDRYLLPDNVEVKIVDPNDHSKVLRSLEKGVGYEYAVWNNRRTADLTIHNIYIEGDVIITAIGYELPPSNATAVAATVADDTIEYGDKAVFTASAVIGKNHTPTYQWYIAPYFQSAELDGVTSWDFEAQNGVALENGTHTVDFGIGAMDKNSTLKAKYSPVEITVSGANKSTLRITGLPKNEFYTDAALTQSPAAEKANLRLGGYHVYCVVKSVRNITGEEVVATSKTVEVQVTEGTYPTPTGLEGSAESYSGKADGCILIESQTDRPKMQYRKKNAGSWIEVTQEQLAAGQISNLAAGDYEFAYPADANHNACTTPAIVTVAQGKKITVTYRAVGADDASLTTQASQVDYNANLNHSGVTQPARTGYVFAGWNPASITAITQDTTVTAVYEPNSIKITLDNQEATAAGSLHIYEKYSKGFYRDVESTTAVSGTNAIEIPKKDGCDFLGYYSAAESGTKYINSDGCLTEAVSNTMYLEAATWYAHWSQKSSTITVKPTVDDPKDPTEPTHGDVEITIKPSDPEEPETEDIDPQKEYDVTVTNTTGKSANTIYIYSDGVVKDVLYPVSFDSKNQYVIEKFKPADYGGGNITFVVGNVSNEKPAEEGGGELTPEEIEEKAKEQAENLNYQINYMDFTGTKAGKAFSGTHVTAAPTKGVKGVAVELPEAVKNGYTFGGWYQNYRGTGGAITAIGADNSDDVTLYAKWISDKYQVLLVLNDGVLAEGVTLPEQYEHGGDNVALPTSEQITRENYEFLGWYENEDLSGNPVSEIDSSKVGNVTYYAGWEILPVHKVTLTPDGNSGAVFELSPKEGYDTPAGENAYSVYHGKEYKFKISKLASAYKVRSVKANGIVLTPDVNAMEYSIASVTTDTVITVETTVIARVDADPNAVATIELADGTTGYFDTLQKAVDYAANYGNNSVILLKKNITATDLDATAGKPYTIDLNGQSLGEGAKVHILAGADLGIKDSGETPQTTDIEVENDGIFRNAVTISKLQNSGAVENSGQVEQMEQLEPESPNIVKSKFVNREGGTVTLGTLRSGYFVEQSSAAEKNPDGISVGVDGYNVIMNGNEYYANFQDAVDIANSSDTDSVIKTLATVDNHDSEINIGNTNGKKITVNLNKKNIENGTVNVSGDVKFANDEGSNVYTSTITAKVNNTETGTTEIGQFVHIEGELDNKGDLAVDNGAKVENVTNEEGGTFENEGEVTGKLTNEGDVTNKGNISNVEQNGGDFTNEGTGDVDNKIQVNGGSYTPGGGSTGEGGKEPENAVAKSGTEPTKYYGTFEDAIDDVNDPEKPLGDNPTIVIIKDITDPDDFGASPVQIDPDTPVTIDLGGHQLGTGTQTIEIGSDDGGSDTPPVTFTGGGTGGVGADIDVNKSGNTVIDEGTKVTGDVINEGGLENKGEIEGDVENKPGGELNNDTGAKITGTTTNEGTLNNDGNLGNVEQKSGTLNNEENGEITKVEQTGGNTENKGDITQADVKGGGYQGEPAGNDGDDPATGKVAYIEKPATEEGGAPEKIYFGDVESALEYAAENGVNPVKLLTDVDITENIDLTKEGEAVLDLNGHEITSSSDPKNGITAGTGTNLVIKDTNPSGGGDISVPVNNNGNLTIESPVEVKETVNNGVSGTINNEGTISGPVNNAGTLNNNPNESGQGGTITGKTTNEGTVNNGGSMGDVDQKKGTLNNETGGNISNLDLQGGSYEPESGADPQVPDSAVAKSGTEPAKYYGTLQGAIDDVTSGGAGENPKIELLTDITDDADLGAKPVGGPVIIDPNTDITIDLNGHNLGSDDPSSTQKIQIGDGTGTPGESGGVTITNSNPSSGGVNTDIDVKGDGRATVDTGAKVTGDVTNEGGLENKGEITGTTTNEGTLNNDGNLRDVEQKSGTLTNGESGTIDTLSQEGGKVSNENTDNEAIKSAEIKGGEYSGTPAKEQEYEGKVEVSAPDGHGGQTTKYYQTLKEALDDAKGNETIKILEYTTETDGVSIDKPGITIDLNGHDVIIPDGKTVTVTENGAGTTITDSGVAEEPARVGQIVGSGSGDTIINNGDLTIDGAKADKIKNNGTLTNDGDIGSLTNEGTATNGENGTIDELTQNKGSFSNEGTINESTIEGGSFEGTPADNEHKAPVAKVGDKLYADIESAIKAANEAGEDTTITLLDDAPITTTPITIANENGKTITIDTNGHDLYDSPAGSATVEIGGKVDITDSNPSDDGSIDIGNDLVVLPEGTLNVDETGSVSSDIDNKGTVNNNGTIGGDITNESGGQINNTKDILGDVENESGGIVQNTGDGFIGGNVDNDGTLTNEAVIMGKVDNEGDFTNEGNVENDVKNHGNGNLDNKGNVNGQLVNSDTATTTNEGNINQVKQEGGSIENAAGAKVNEVVQTGGDFDNSGEVTKATVSNIDNYTGVAPTQGLPGADASVTYTDDTGREVTKYYPTFEDALNDAETKSPSTLNIVNSPTEIDEPITIPEGVSLNIPTGKELVIENGGSLDVEGRIVNNGQLDVESGGALNVGEEGSLVNNSDIDNEGTIDNKGTVSNNGDISNKGTGTFENEGEIKNTTGTLNGDSDATGTIINEGSVSGGEINGPFENTEGGKISSPSKISGEITNEGKIEVTPSTDISGSEITGEGTMVTVYPPAPPRGEEEKHSSGSSEPTPIVVIPPKPTLIPVLPIAANQADTRRGANRQVADAEAENGDGNGDGGIGDNGNNESQTADNNQPELIHLPETENNAAAGTAPSDDSSVSNENGGGSDAADNLEGEGILGWLKKRSENGCLMHWGILIATAAYMAALYLMRDKKKKLKVALAGTDAAVAIVLAALGGCVSDIPMAAGSILVALPALNIIKSQDGEGVLKSENGAIDKVCYVAACIGAAAIVISTIMAL